MTRPVGDKFEHNGQFYNVVIGDQCILCAFHGSMCTKPRVAGFCSGKVRTDKHDVIFVKSR